jgi:membrane protein YdbS with pleckstrin-like domain
VSSRHRHRTEEGNVDRTKASWFLIAFAVIGILTIIEGINDGFTVLNWLVIAVSVVFLLQAVWTLTRGSSRT